MDHQGTARHRNITLNHQASTSPVAQLGRHQVPKASGKDRMDIQVQTAQQQAVRKQAVVVKQAVVAHSQAVAMHSKSSLGHCIAAMMTTV